MYEDPQDMFRELDEMFARMFTRMNRGIGSDEPQIYGYHIVIHGGDDHPVEPEKPALPMRGDSAPVPEVHHIDNEVKVIVDLPGAPAESVTLSVQGGKLVIDAEGCMNHYHTTADLPPVNVDSMQSSFRNGVLELTFGALLDRQDTIS